MIRLTRINQTEFYLNADLIEFIEVSADTVVTTVNGQKLRILEPADEVVRRVEAYKRRLACQPPRLETPEVLKGQENGGQENGCQENG